MIAQNDVGRLGAIANVALCSMVHAIHRNNRIVSVAPDAFVHLAALQATPAEFARNNINWTDSHGIGLWPHKPGETYFGGSDSSGQGWANLPILLAPNPVKCEWVGPNISNVNCTSCALGYETASEGNRTCVQPEFRPYKKWGRLEQAQLRLQGERGSNAVRDRRDEGTPAVAPPGSGGPAAATDKLAKQVSAAGAAVNKTKADYDRKCSG